MRTGFTKQAYDIKPTDLKYRSAVERLRFSRGRSHVHRGQVFAKQGKLAEALAEFAPPSTSIPPASSPTGDPPYPEDDPNASTNGTPAPGRR